LSKDVEVGGTESLSSQTDPRRRVGLVCNPETVAKSRSIGDPADGDFAATLIPETGGWSEDVVDEAMTSPTGPSGWSAWEISGIMHSRSELRPRGTSSPPPSMAAPS
jgi:hypothetical protein